MALNVRSVIDSAIKGMKRMKSMKIFKTLLGLILLLTTFKANAGLRFSFNLDASAWQATHIVIVTEGQEIDGQVTVLESIKGDLKIGEVITIPEFAVFKTKANRKVGIDVEVLKVSLSKLEPNSNLPTSNKGEDSEYLQNEKLNNSYITCKQMMLFLIKSENDSKVIWKPVNKTDGYFLSTIWLEPESAFIFYQRISDEPTALHPNHMNEYQLKDYVFNVGELRNSFNQAMTINDAEKRAEALLFAARSPILCVKSQAFEELKKCGKSALPALRVLMNDLSITENSRYIFETIGVLGDEQIGNESTAIITEELDFWRRTTPYLKVKWWTHYLDDDTVKLRNRYDRAYYAIIALRNLKVAGCKGVVTEFRDYWHSQPFFETSDYLKQMSMECDKTLESLNGH
jgi:hypothetical protein